MKNAFSRVVTLLYVLAAFAFLISTGSCKLPGFDDDDDDNTDVSIADLAGSWLKDYGTGNYMINSGEVEIDAVLLAVASSNYEIIFFYNTEQAFGVRGTLSISGESLVLNTTQEWDNTNYWQSDPSSDSIPFTLSGTTLSITPPDETVPIALTKTAFSSPSSLFGTWETADSSQTFVLDDSGYQYTSTAYGNESGNEWSISGTTNGYFANTTLLRNSTSVNIAYLTPYTLSADNLILTYPDVGPVTFIRDSTPNPDITLSDLAGSWLKDFGTTPYELGEAPNTVAVDTIILDVESSNYKIVFYEDREQVYGAIGTAAVSGENLVLTPTSEWNNETKLWETIFSENETVPFTLDGEILTITPPGETVPIALTKTTFARPSTLCGSWKNSGKTEAFTLNSDGTFSYTSTEYDAETGDE